LTLLSGVLGAVLPTVVAGKAVTIQVIEGGFTLGLGAAGGWTMVKRLLWPPDKKVPTPNGKVTP